jgi:hypothetical protein
VEETAWKIQTSANMEEEQQWNLEDGTSIYMSRIGIWKHDAEKHMCISILD